MDQDESAGDNRSVQNQLRDALPGLERQPAEDLPCAPCATSTVRSIETARIVPAAARRRSIAKGEVETKTPQQRQHGAVVDSITKGGATRREAGPR